MAWTIPLYFSPPSPSLVWAINLVLTTSKGPVQKGPAVPAKNPEIMDCQGCKAWPSPSCLFHKRTSKEFLAVNMTAWLVPLRITVGAAPDHRPKKDSSLTMVRAQWMGPLYLKSSGLKPFCCWSLIFTTWRFRGIKKRELNRIFRN